MPELVVNAQSLSKRYGQKTVLSEISAAAETGDVIGVLGKNGAGKTTLFEVLLGFSPPSAGQAQVFGQNSMKMTEAVKTRIGFVPQQDELVDILSGAQLLRVTAAFYRDWDHELVERLSAAWEIPLHRRIQTLSVGERQKLSLLLALGPSPELLVLDEPVASLDPMSRRAFLQEILDVSDDDDRTVLFSSHIVSDLERAANKIWIIKDGALAWQGDLDDLKESVVRLHLRSERELPRDLAIPHAVSTRIDGRNATVAVTKWRPAEERTLATRLNTKIEVETLGLEDIFLELHQ